MGKRNAGQRKLDVRDFKTLATVTLCLCSLCFIELLCHFHYNDFGKLIGILLTYYGKASTFVK